MALEARAKRMIREAVREIDPQQIAINRKLNTTERFAKMVSMIAWAERSGAYRLRLR